MSDLIVVGFDDMAQAEQVQARLVELQKQHLLDLEDAVIAIRDPGGKVRLRQSIALTSLGTTSGLITGGLWGSLVGLLFLNPLAGFAIGGAVGAGAGALSGALSDYGINDEFVKSLGKALPNASSALFILVRKAQPEKVLAELSGVKAKVLHTSLSPEHEAKLQRALLDLTEASRA